ncbi:MAG: hypothetical protein DWP92_06230, partial [Armatimonadetes bacterium]
MPLIMRAVFQDRTVRMFFAVLVVAFVAVTIGIAVAHDSSPSTETAQVEKPVVPVGGPVTFAEYEAAMVRAVDCMNDRVPDAKAGLGRLVDRGQNYTVTYRALVDVDVDRAWADCHHKYAAPVEAAWQAQNARTWDKDLAWMVDEYRECANRIVGSESDSANVIHDATQRMLDAPSKDAVETFDQFMEEVSAVAASSPLNVMVLECLDE